MSAIGIDGAWWLAVCLALGTCGHAAGSGGEGPTDDPHPRTSEPTPARPPAGGRWCPEAWVVGGERYIDETLTELAVVHGELASSAPAPWRAVPRVHLDSQRLELRLPEAEPGVWRARSHDARSGALIAESTLDPSAEAEPSDDPVALLEIELPAIGSERTTSLPDGQRLVLRTTDFIDADFVPSPQVRVDIGTRCSWVVTFSQKVFDPAHSDRPRWELWRSSLWSDPTGQVWVAVATYRRDDAPDPAHSRATVYTVLGSAQ